MTYKFLISPVFLVPLVSLSYFLLMKILWRKCKAERIIINKLIIIIDMKVIRVPVGADPLCGLGVVVDIEEAAGRGATLLPTWWQVRRAAEASQCVDHCIVSCSTAPTVTWQQWHDNLPFHWLRVLCVRLAQVQSLVYNNNHINKCPSSIIKFINRNPLFLCW